MNAHVHGTLTKRWAMELGYSEEDARRIGAYDVNVDSEYWAWKLPRGRNLKYHFAPLGARRLSRRYLEQAIAEKDPEAALHDLGVSLHSAQDAVAHGRLGLGHMRYELSVALGLKPRHPDRWEDASSRKRVALERDTKRILQAFASAKTRDIPAANSSRARPRSSG